MITIVPEPEKRRLSVTMGDLLTVSEVIAFGRDEQAAIAAMGMRSGEFDLLVVTRGNIVQTQEVTQALAGLMLESPLKARKIATVRDGVLTRMQIRRLSQVRSNAQVFESISEAEAWLDATE